MALKKLKLNQKKNFNVCLERVIPVSEPQLHSNNALFFLSGSLIDLLKSRCTLADKENCNSRGSPRDRSLRRRGNVFLNYFHACLNMTNSCREFLQRLITRRSEISSVLCLSRGKKAERLRSAAGS